MAAQVSQPPDVSPGGSSALPANAHTALPQEANPPSYPQLWVKVPRYLYHTTRVTLSCTKANILLGFVPLSIIAAAREWNPVAVFTLSFLAIFPLAELLSWSTEQVAASVGQTIGGLLNATCGNLVEMIVSRPYTPPLNLTY
jgi:Ca2+:H+ antiporter